MRSTDGELESSGRIGVRTIVVVAAVVATFAVSAPPASAAPAVTTHAGAGADTLRDSSWMVTKVKGRRGVRLGKPKPKVIATPKRKAIVKPKPGVKAKPKVTARRHSPTPPASMKPRSP